MENTVSKTNDNRIYFFMATILAIFAPAPGRFAYAITLLLLFNIQMASLTLFFHLMNLLKLNKFRNILMAMELVFVTILFKQVLILFCPIMALTLGFCIYLPALSTVAIQFFFLHKNESLKEHFLNGMSNSLMFSLCSLMFFFLRELVGYATVSFPGYGRLIIFNIPISEKIVSAGIYFATIPGSLTLIAILFALYIFITKQFGIVKNSKIQSEEK